MKCIAIIETKCSKGHKVTTKCHDKAAALCKKCEVERRAQEMRQKRDYQLDQECQAKQQAYAIKLSEIQDEIEHQKRLLKDRADGEMRQHALSQKKQDLLNLKKKAINPPKPPVTPEPREGAPVAPLTSNTFQGEATTSPALATSPERSESPSNDSASTKHYEQPDWDQSDTRDEWQEQKELWGADNEALDSLMSMIGK
jgi:hypothetical protein